MRWPWVSRAKFDEIDAMRQAAENLRVHANNTLGFSEASRQRLEERVAGLESERKVLLDRIVEMSGQRPIYERQPAASREEPAEKPGDLPAPKRQVTFDDIHETARRAIADGSFSLGGRRAN